MLRGRLAARLGDRMTPEPPAPRAADSAVGQPHAVLLLGLPAQLVHQGARGFAGRRRHRLPQHGDDDGARAAPATSSASRRWATRARSGSAWRRSSTTTHLIQNLGDGTLFHSGMTAIRAAIANGANITYKILYNGAVAMTGGQDPFGQLDVPTLCKVLQAEGVKRDHRHHRRAGPLSHASTCPIGVQGVGSRPADRGAGSAGRRARLHRPDSRPALRRREAARPQARRASTRPTFRVVINERVCEGCGDCGDKSNCLSVQPIDTPFGRKTRIDQGSCNFDFSCMKGDCPAFMTVTVAPEKTATGARRRSQPLRTAAAPTCRAPPPTLRR